MPTVFPAKTTTTNGSTIASRSLIGSKIGSPPTKGMYAVSRSCERQPSKNVSSVLTFAMKPAALAQHKNDRVLRGLFVGAK